MERLPFSKSLLACALAGLAAIPAAATGQEYPNRPVKIITPYAPGGASDILARTLAAKLTELWGRQAVVENRAGGSGIVGTEAVKAAAPDGYTLELGTITTHVLNPLLLPAAKYDGIKDFTPVTLMANSPFVLIAHPSLKVKNVAELIALARAQPGKLNFGSSGIGTSNHLSGELFKAMAGVDIVHVPYKGGSQSITGVLSNEIQLLFDPLPTPSVNHARQGALVLLATTGRKRSRAVPDVPTVAEGGLPGYETGAWYGIFGPAGVPRPIVDRLAADVARAVEAPDVQAKLAELGNESVTTTPEGFIEVILKDREVWSRLIRERNIKAAP